ncbi:MAG: beta-ketoacyl synthase [Tannerella sp.]|jgi:3-oxoacyl-[acyl-carrier-protein] synthase-1|nr:beta-ketoacyl synthase [Tannerella sp.]
MTTLLGDSIVSALGFTTDENFRKVRDGLSGLTFFDGRQWGVSEPFVASVIDDAALDRAFHALPRAAEKRYTRLEKAVILSVANALKDSPVDPSGEGALFILSTTKGNVFLLDPDESGNFEPVQVCLWRSAELIAGYFGNPNTPLVVSNACISGACALIAARRALQAGRYEHVIVAGADMLSRFIVAGFQSFKALSQERCKPFDARRSGLNLGEAAATLVLTEKPAEALQPGEVVLTAGAVCNDANHISGPSRTGEGAFRALKHVLSGVEAGEPAFVNAHGTATPYNDEMEAVAIHRAALQDLPVTSLKGYFGHTLGGAGVLESIISTRALREGIVLKTAGFNTPGVSQPLRIVAHTQPVEGRRCINMLSGFGGCNAALLYTVKRME